MWIRCKHKTQKLSYLTGHADAKKRMKKGEKQRFCPVCRKYIWESLFEDKDNGRSNM